MYWTKNQSVISKSFGQKFYQIKHLMKDFLFDNDLNLDLDFTVI